MLTARFDGRPRSLLSLTVLAVTVLAASGCAEMFPDKISTGIARLTVRNVAAMAALVGTDTHCGFESDAVLANPIIEGETGGEGRVTWRVEDCTIETDETLVKSDCRDVAMTASGKFTITAEKIIEGRLTGDSVTPVVPGGPETVTLKIIESTFDMFQVLSSDSPSNLTMVEGSISAELHPKLAASISTGLCSVITPIIRFTEIHYAQSSVGVQSPELNFAASVNDSDFWAQTGRWQSDENQIEGTLSVFGGEHPVPNDGGGLDPMYEAFAFADSFACADDLALPARYECEPGPVLAENAARLSMQTLAALVGAVADDTVCGFSSDSAALDTTGEVGHGPGGATWTISGCVLDYPTPTVVATDCQGIDTIVQGHAVVSGTKHIDGILSGDPAEPVVPTSRDGVTLSVEAALTGFSVRKGDVGLTVETGVLAGNVAPRLALDTTTGVCSKPTPVAALSNVSLSDAQVRVLSGDMQIGLAVASADLTGTSGRRGNVANRLDGVVEVDGASVEIEALPLDPEYDPITFDAAFNCDVDMEVPVDDDTCDFHKQLVSGASRLLTKTFGMVVKGTDSDPDCGFASVDGVVPADVDGAVGDRVTAAWDVNDCDIGRGAETLLQTDCNGKGTYLQGHTTIDATKRATGDLAVGYPPILPRDRVSARFDFWSVSFDEFAVTDYEEGDTEPSPYMVVHSGTVTGVGLPVTGEATDEPGAYFIAIPVTGLENIRYQNADVTIHVGAKHFDLHVDASDITAFNGAYQGTRNAIAGSVTIEGVYYELPVFADDPDLDPEYDQAVFDSAYVCYENLKEVVPTP